MPEHELIDLEAWRLSELLRRREVSSVEVVRAFAERIAVAEPCARSFLTITVEQAEQAAADIDRRRAREETLSPLAGIPVALKDNLCTRGVRTTCGSRMLADFTPPYTATAVERIGAAGGVSIGKTNLDEFAMGSSTENSAFGPSRNPWDPSRVPGGSSGGSAAAVAAREAPLALGSDTGGSIRQPASLCGVVGLKPTYGRVSRYGLVAYASSLDQIGPIGGCARDVSMVLEAIAGKDPRDSTSIDAGAFVPPSWAEADLQGLRVGVPVEFFGAGTQPGVDRAVRDAIEVLCGLGASAEECSIPSVAHCLAVYYILAPAEASSNLARYDGVKYGHRSRLHEGHVGLTEQSRAEGFGAEVKHRIMVGTYALSAGYYDAYYRRAQQVRTLIRREFEQVLGRYDVLVAPTSPVVAFRLGERSSDPLAMKLADACTLPANLAGLPGISTPCGFSEGLPVGLQIMARAFDEAMLLRVADAYEQATDWRLRRPPVRVGPTDR